MARETKESIRAQYEKKLERLENEAHYMQGECQATHKTLDHLGREIAYRDREIDFLRRMISNFTSTTSTQIIAHEGGFKDGGKP